ncbi:MAG: RNA helicase required for poly(A+) mRNA export [Heterodermia speciosa]|uniref:RNA helicase n=1 Tax=Heterodermia speciosa TaxID=116794 RepID=A0A8H3EAR1_9LECA|nr:MAG: RNA helicase required for poly(A+) mRNA export [Heterodermia speciosa]
MAADANPGAPSKTPSLEDRITMPEHKDIPTLATVEVPADPETASGRNVPGHITSWADEVNSPADTQNASVDELTSKANEIDLSHAQMDGATEAQNGSPQIYEPTYDVNVKLSDVQADPNNPLYSIKSFDELGLHPALLKGISQMRFHKPSKIQEKALPLLMKNPPTNMIGQSQSGTGKTAAFALNILSRVDFNGMSRPQALVLAPTRELARQIVGVFQVMSQFVENVNIGACIPMDKASRNQVFTAQIIVGTPGTTMDMIRRRLLIPTDIKVLVLDEADNMLEQQGLGDQCIRVKNLLPKTIQIVLFSATFPDHVVSYAQKFAPDANQITLKHEELTVEGIRQLYLDCSSEKEKFECLLKLYGVMTVGSSIIFVKTRASAVQIQDRMEKEGHKVACLTGQFEGADRDLLIDAFREGQAKVLIATNVLARGIDVQTVSLVINYDIPEDVNGRPDPATYLHRIGRTGRFGRVGVSISLVHDHRSFGALKYIGDYFKIPLTGLNKSDWDNVEETVRATLKSSRAGANFKDE